MKNILFETEIDFEKYNTFFLQYYKDDYRISGYHAIRPSTAKYEYIVDTDKFRNYTLEGTVICFNEKCSLEEIIMECTIRGISLDFIDVYVCDENSHMGEKLIEVIDLHKKDIKDICDKLSYPRYYVAKSKDSKRVRNKNKYDTDILKYLVIDSSMQSMDMDILSGDYDKKAIIAGFPIYQEAVRYCKDKNNRK